jgi:uncharacterized protein (TIGR03084 family)
MLEILRDLRTELTELDAFVSGLREAEFYGVTPFYEWRVYDEILHLHFVDWLGMLSMTDGERFKVEGERMHAASSKPDYHMAPYTQTLFGVPDRAGVMKLWRDGYTGMLDHFEQADPKARMTWFGPPMGYRSFATARLMEAWAHGQDIYDAFAVRRRNDGRIRHVADIGVRTFGFSFMIHGEPVPEGPPPYVALTAPDGEIWTWNDPDSPQRLTGPAEDFCMIVTQRRNVADTALQATGEGVTRWMQIAQCFAGGPALGPAPGQRVVRYAD